VGKRQGSGDSVYAFCLLFTQTDKKEKMTNGTTVDTLVKLLQQYIAASSSNMEKVQGQLDQVREKIHREFDGKIETLSKKLESNSKHDTELRIELVSLKNTLSALDSDIVQLQKSFKEHINDANCLNKDLNQLRQDGKWVNKLVWWGAGILASIIAAIIVLVLSKGGVIWGS